VTEQVIFERISPVVPVLDLDAALNRYQRLGFDVESYAGGERYGFVERGSVSIHVTEWNEHDPKRTRLRTSTSTSLTPMSSMLSGPPPASRAVSVNRPTRHMACVSSLTLIQTAHSTGLAHPIETSRLALADFGLAIQSECPRTRCRVCGWRWPPALGTRRTWHPSGSENAEAFICQNGFAGSTSG
jgi:hypothetical protein